MPDETQPNAAAQVTEIAQVRTWLSLPETASIVEIEGAITSLKDKAANAQSGADEAQSSLQTITADRDRLKSEFDALYARQTELDKKQREAEADAALALVKDQIPAEKSAQLRELYLANPDSAKSWLEVLAHPKAQPSKETPPSAVHDPSKVDGTTMQQDEQAIADATKARVAAAQAAGDSRAYSVLWAAIESQVRADAAAGKSL